MAGINEMSREHWDTMAAALRYYDDVVYEKLTNTEAKIPEIQRQAWTEERKLIADCKDVVPSLQKFFEIK
jgi:hypothetical protein